MTTHAVLCASCKIPLKIGADPKPQDMVACSGCGQSDTFENVKREIQEFAKEYAANAISEAFGSPAQETRYLKITKDVAPKRNYRFIVNPG